MSTRRTTRCQTRDNIVLILNCILQKHMSMLHHNAANCSTHIGMSNVANHIVSVLPLVSVREPRP